jgi:glycine cleavage system H protein
MDGFSYNNIFETKGIEYLIIITFLFLIIPFWIMINKRETRRKRIINVPSVLTAEMLRIPKGIFFSENHTWTHLERSGNSKVGLDDFLLHTTGDVKLSNLITPGNFIEKGELMGDIDNEGRKLQLTSPVSGMVVRTNSLLSAHAGAINEDPFGEGWIYEITPAQWKADTGNYHLAGDAVSWSKREIERLKDFLAVALRKYSPVTPMTILQDGGELCDNPLAELPGEVWQDFQKTFLK